MMRPITCLSLLVALGAGLYLYQVKHRAQLLDRDINRTVKLAEATRDRIGLLKAEWALLEDPQRLQDLATHHLQLQPLQPAQFVRLQDLSSRLPLLAPTDPAPSEPAVAAETPASPPTPPLVTLAQAPTPITPTPIMPTPAHVAPSRPARPTVLASAAKPRPLYAPVVPVYEASPVPAPAMVHAPTVQTASVTAPWAAEPTTPYVGSALGMARTGLAPPAPVAPGAGYGSAAQR